MEFELPCPTVVVKPGARVDFRATTPVVFRPMEIRVTSPRMEAVRIRRVEESGVAGAMCPGPRSVDVYKYGPRIDVSKLCRTLVVNQTIVCEVENEGDTDVTVGITFLGPAAS